MEFIITAVISIAVYNIFLKIKQWKDQREEQESGYVESPVTNQSTDSPQKAEDPLFTVFQLKQQQNFLRQRFEVGKGENKNEEQPSSADLLLMSIIDQLDHSHLGKPIKMVIKCGDKIEELTDEYRIMSFDIREFIKSHPEGKTVRIITFHIEYESNDVVMTLVANNEDTAHARYFRLTAFTLLPSDEYSSFSSLIEVSFADSNQDYWEAKYMIDEALAEVEKKKDEADMSAKTLATLSVINPSCANDLYWGRKYYKFCTQAGAHNLIHQALYHLYRVNSFLRQQVPTLNENGKDVLIEVNTCIGHLSMMNSNYEEAFHYLDVARRGNTIFSLMLYYDCLCMLMSPGVEYEIKDALGNILKYVNSNPEAKEGLTEYIRFLNRRLVYVYMQYQCYGDAEIILNRMLANGEDAPDYINDTLKQINEAKERVKVNADCEETQES